MIHLLLKFRPMGTAVEEANKLKAECKPQLVHPTPGTHVSELPVSNRIFRNRRGQNSIWWAKFSSVLRSPLQPLEFRNQTRVRSVLYAHPDA